MSQFFKDKTQNNIFVNFVTLAEHSEEPQLAALTANTTDAAQEKHVPVVSIQGSAVEVTVGSAAHPMLEEHFITGIYIETKFGGQFRRLNPGEEPKASFLLPEGDEFIAAYEYCNLHGLWKAEK